MKRICAVERLDDPGSFGFRLESAAGAIDGRLRAAFGGRYPRPALLIAAREGKLRGAGLSGRKAATLRAVARAFEEGRLSTRKLGRLDDDGVIEAVTEIKGVGEWTAQMLLIFTLGRPDVLPVGDYGVRKAAMSLYGLEELPQRAELETLGEPWRPYRTVASWYLWRHSDISTPNS